MARIFFFKKRKKLGILKILVGLICGVNHVGTSICEKLEWREWLQHLRQVIAKREKVKTFHEEEEKFDGASSNSRTLFAAASLLFPRLLSAKESLFYQMG